MNDKVDVLHTCTLPHVEKPCTVWAFEDELVKRQEALGVHIPIPHEWSADPRGWGLYLLMGPLTCQSNQWKKQLCEWYRDLCSVFVYKHIPTAIKFTLLFMCFMWCNCEHTHYLCSVYVMFVCSFPFVAITAASASHLLSWRKCCVLDMIQVQSYPADACGRAFHILQNITTSLQCNIVVARWEVYRYIKIFVL